MTVPIIKSIGLAQGLLVWGSFNLMAGWASGRFGWFGIDPEVPTNVTLNYIGMAPCFSSAFLYILIKTEVKPISPSEPEPKEQLDPKPDSDEIEAILPRINEVCLQ